MNCIDCHKRPIHKYERCWICYLHFLADGGNIVKKSEKLSITVPAISYLLTQAKKKMAFNQLKDKMPKKLSELKETLSNAPL